MYTEPSYVKRFYCSFEAGQEELFPVFQMKN